MHSTHFQVPLSRFQVVVAVLLAIVSSTSAQAFLKLYVTMYPNWQCAGCFSDTNPDQSVRALNTEVTVPGGLANASVENCIGECKSLNFGRAGMEQQKCWCGQVLSAGTGAPIDIRYCSTPCTGDSQEWCGGDGALLVYHDSTAV
ncbi:hypothetical protein EI94DRAFT_1745706 [Lactarius quietus]|nr:hypothetical protein EI94DRAFT_1745706 [Lactarius quietus]